jgi:hypothetical protein
LPVLEDLAADEAFHGNLIVGITPQLFFSGRAIRGGVVKYTQQESPAQRAGQWISMQIEPWLGFYDADYALATVVERQDWPTRPGMSARIKVRRLSVSGPDRDTHLWHKVVDDPEYQALARRIWTQNFTPPPDAPPQAVRDKVRDEQIDRAVGGRGDAQGTRRRRGVRARTQRRAVPRIREPRLPARVELGRADREGRRSRHPLRGLSRQQRAKPPEWSHLDVRIRSATPRRCSVPGAISAPPGRPEAAPPG